MFSVLSDNNSAAYRKELAILLAGILLGSALAFFILNFTAIIFNHAFWKVTATVFLLAVIPAFIHVFRNIQQVNQK